MIAVRGDTLEQAIAALSRTRRCMQLYPAANPVVRMALEQLQAAFRAPVSPDPLEANAPPKMITCDIRATGFHDSGGRLLGAGFPEMAVFAGLLHRAGARRFYFQAGVPLQALMAFVCATMALERGTAPENLPELTQPGLGLEFAEQPTDTPEAGQAPAEPMEDFLAHLMARRGARMAGGGPGAQAAAGRQHLEDIVAFFLALERGDETRKTELRHTLGDPARIAEAYSYVGHVPGSKTQENGAPPAVSRDALRQTLRHLAGAVEELPADMHAQALANLAEAVVITDPQTRACFMEYVLPAGIGQGGVEDEVTGQLPMGAAIRVLLCHAVTQEAPADGLRAFLDAVRPARQRASLAAGLLAALESNTEAPLDTEVRRVLEAAGAGKHGAMAPPVTEASANLVSRRDAMASLARQMTGAEARALRKAATGTTNDEQQAALSHFHLFAIGCAGEHDQGMLDRLRHALKTAIAQENFDFPNHVIQLALGLVRPGVREEAYPTLLPYVEPLYQEPNFAQFLAHLSQLAETQENARAVIRALASGTAPAVFQSLAREEVKARRLALLDLLLSMGPTILGFLREQVNHPHWYVARNTVYLLGRLPEHGNLRALDRALRHRDARVREEALSSLQTHEPAEAAPLIAKALHDPEEDLRARAAQLLAESGQTPYSVDLIEMLRAQGAELRRQPVFALALVRALGTLCHGASLEDLERLRRQAWLPGARNRGELRAACAEAMAAIRKRAGSAPGRNTP